MLPPGHWLFFLATHFPQADIERAFQRARLEPWARGLGLGSALVDECVNFAREAGYDRIRLWTHTVLAPARRIYEKAGFRIVSTEVHHEFGKPEQGETWELALGG